jgi:lipid-A-disaccharide synthase
MIPPRILVTAGEPSGDLHGARVVRALRDRWPDATIHALGGPHLAAAGAEVRWSADGLAAMGLVEVLETLPAHLKLLRTLKRACETGTYDLLITIDYPGFHLRLAEAAHAAKVPVLWYIAPQLWAWHPSRAARLARAVDRLAVILPFEPAFFESAGIPSTYVGHPLLDRDAPPTRAAARASLGIPADARVLALFPGSRRGEIGRLWPAYRSAAQRLRGEGHCTHVVVAGTAWGEYPEADGMQVVRADPSLVLAAADAALAKSGTTTLETALADVPMVVAYRTNAITFWLAQRLVTVPWVSLVNLIVEREVVPELMQGEATPDRLVAMVAPLLDPASPEAAAQRSGFAEVRARLGGAGASARVAALAGELLGR